LKLVNALLIKRKYLGGHHKRIVEQQFPPIQDVRLDRESRAVIDLDVLVAETEVEPQGIHGQVKREHIVGDIHMTIDVYPLRQHLAAADLIT
jgi:hypothetical protein